MRLYYASGSCALSPHIVAREAGLPVELSKVTFGDGVRTTEQGEDFFAVNTKGGYVPALRLDNQEVIAEGPAIIQYLADQAPAKALMPEKGSMEHYRAIEWIAFINSELHKGFGIFFKQDATDAEKVAPLAKLTKRYAFVEGALAGKEYLLDSFSVADAYLYTILRWTPKSGISLAAYPNLSSFVARMETREGVKTALAEEGLEPFKQ